MDQRCTAARVSVTAQVLAASQGVRHLRS
jgi:hypothetical protein